MQDEKFYYQESVLMAHEVDLAGEFIYSALNKVNSMKSIDEPTDSFFVMYHLSVGIERLQKVLLVILEDVQMDNIGKFVNSIKMHNLLDLNGKIQSKTKIGFSPEQKGLLSVLSDFYKNHRYNKYDFYSYDMDSPNSLSSFLKQYYSSYEETYSLLSERHLNNEEIKDFVGKCVGTICQKYYQKIWDVSHEKNIYCYELRHESAAEKIFQYGIIKKRRL